jgi:hypothetical protein
LFHTALLMGCHAASPLSQDVLTVELQFAPIASWSVAGTHIVNTATTTIVTHSFVTKPAQNERDLLLTFRPTPNGQPQIVIGKLTWQYHSP